MERVEHHKSFGGAQEVWEHAAPTLGGVTMRFGVYLPPRALAGQRCPVLYFLSGLTCSEQNVITKGGYQAAAAEHGLIVVAPDTSPRGDGVADDEAYDLGQGAGFYVNATEAPWAAHYQMHDYVVHALPELVEATFTTTGARGITGHSMGGHGALVCALRNPGRYKSVSAIAPIVAPSEVPWGHKALGAYLGEDRAAWAPWDACQLVGKAFERLPVLIDQGEDDPFLARELQPERFVSACEAAGYPLTLRRHVGYDHSYYFISTVMADHLAHHAGALKAG